MKRGGSLPVLFLFGLLLTMQGFAYSDDGPFDDSLVSAVEYPGWFKRSFLDLPEDLREAGAAGKSGLMIVFGTQGCAYCKALVERVLSDPKVQGVIRRHFDAIAVEMFSDIEMVDPKGVAMPVKQFASQEGAEFSPTVIFYDLDGNPEFRAVGYYSRDRFRTALDYVIDKAYRSISFGDYLNARAVNAESSGNSGVPDRQRTSAPGSASREPDAGTPRPALVIFERRGCQACRSFQQQVLSDREIAASLQEFDLQRVDVDAVLPIRTRDNRLLPASQWMATLAFTRLPALAFYDRDNQLVLRTDAQVGRQRMRNALSYVLTGAYSQGMSYQQYAHLRAAEKSIR